MFSDDMIISVDNPSKLTVRTTKQMNKSWLSGKESACNAGDASLLPGWVDPLEKDMATLSSTLSWEIP